MTPDASNNAVEIYSFPTTGTDIRTVLIDGEPWFVAADVCNALGIVNVGNVLMRLDEDERGSIRLADGTPGNPIKGVVNEPGLFSLVLRSDKTQAKAFKRWVTHEVLPSIRKTGRYGAPPSELTEIEVARKYLAALEDKHRLLARVTELEPDAARAQQTMDADGLSLVGTVALHFKVAEHDLRKFLYDEQLLIRDGSRRNLPYARGVQAGYFEVKVKVVNPSGTPFQVSTTYVTPKGEAMIWRRLYEAGKVSSPTMPATKQLALITV